MISWPYSFFVFLQHLPFKGENNPTIYPPLQKGRIDFLLVCYQPATTLGVESAQISRSLVVNLFSLCLPSTPPELAVSPAQALEPLALVGCGWKGGNVWEQKQQHWCWGWLFFLLFFVYMGNSTLETVDITEKTCGKRNRTCHLSKKWLLLKEDFLGEEIKVFFCWLCKLWHVYLYLV